jgi:hypothetical protein
MLHRTRVPSLKRVAIFDPSGENLASLKWQPAWACRDLNLVTVDEVIVLQILQASSERVNKRPC